MKTYSYYSAETGLFNGLQVTNTEEAAEAMCPQGFVMIEGAFDPICQRVDIETGLVVGRVPPKPDDTIYVTHEWNGQRWIEVPTLEGLKSKLIDALKGHLAAIEGSTDRALREMVLVDPGHAAYARFLAIEERAAPFRVAINDVMAAASAEDLDTIRRRPLV